jgi:hypothetical protein
MVTTVAPWISRPRAGFPRRLGRRVRRRRYCSRRDKNQQHAQSCNPCLHFNTPSAADAPIGVVKESVVRTLGQPAVGPKAAH